MKWMERVGIQYVASTPGGERDRLCLKSFVLFMVFELPWNFLELYFFKTTIQPDSLFKRSYKNP